MHIITKDLLTLQHNKQNKLLIFISYILTGMVVEFMYICMNVCFKLWIMYVSMYVKGICLVLF